MSGWYLKSVSSEKTWTNAKTEWGDLGTSYGQYIYDLSGSIQPGSSDLTWRKIDTATDPSLNPLSAYWFKVVEAASSGSGDSGSGDSGSGDSGSGSGSSTPVEYPPPEIQAALDNYTLNMSTSTENGSNFTVTVDGSAYGNGDYIIQTTSNGDNDAHNPKNLFDKRESNFYGSNDAFLYNWGASQANAIKYNSDGTPNSNASELVSGVKGEWVSITLPDTITLSQYYIKDRVNHSSSGNYGGNASPLSWALYGSNDGSTYTEIDTHTDNNTIKDTGVITVDVTPGSAFNQYVLVITKVNNKTWFGLGEFKLFGTAGGSGDSGSGDSGSGSGAPTPGWKKVFRQTASYLWSAESESSPLDNMKNNQLNTESDDNYSIMNEIFNSSTRDNYKYEGVYKFKMVNTEGYELTWTQTGNPFDYDNEVPGTVSDISAVNFTVTSGGAAFDGLMVSQVDSHVILGGVVGNVERYVIGQVGNSVDWNGVSDKIVTIPTNNGETWSDWVELYAYVSDSGSGDSGSGDSGSGDSGSASGESAYTWATPAGPPYDLTANVLKPYTGNVVSRPYAFENFYSSAVELSESSSEIPATTTTPTGDYKTYKFGDEYIRTGILNLYFNNTTPIYNSTSAFFDRMDVDVDSFYRKGRYIFQSENFTNVTFADVTVNGAAQYFTFLSSDTTKVSYIRIFAVQDYSAYFENYTPSEVKIYGTNDDVTATLLGTNTSFKTDIAANLADATNNNLYTNYSFTKPDGSVEDDMPAYVDITLDSSAETSGYKKYYIAYSGSVGSGRMLGGWVQFYYNLPAGGSGDSGSGDSGSGDSGSSNLPQFNWLPFDGSETVTDLNFQSAKFYPIVKLHKGEVYGLHNDSTDAHASQKTRYLYKNPYSETGNRELILTYSDWASLGWNKYRYLYVFCFDDNDNLYTNIYAGHDSGYKQDQNGIRVYTKQDGTYTYSHSIEESTIRTAYDANTSGFHAQKLNMLHSKGNYLYYYLKKNPSGGSTRYIYKYDLTTSSVVAEYDPAADVGSDFNADNNFNKTGYGFDSNGNIWWCNYGPMNILLTYFGGTIFGSDVDYDGNAWVEGKTYIMSKSRYESFTLASEGQGQHIKDLQPDTYVWNVHCDIYDNVYFTLHGTGKMIMINGGTGLVDVMTADIGADTTKVTVDVSGNLLISTRPDHSNRQQIITRRKS